VKRSGLELLNRIPQTSCVPRLPSPWHDPTKFATDTFITSPLAGAKYCNQFVCLSVTLSNIIPANHVQAFCQGGQWNSLHSFKQRVFMPEIWNCFCPPVSVHVSYSRFRDMEQLIVFEYLRWTLTILCWKLELGPCPQLFRMKIKCSVLTIENELK